MLTTVNWHSRHDRSTRLKCPACRAPMVGTSPTSRQSHHAASTADRSSSSALMTRARLLRRCVDLLTSSTVIQARGFASFGEALHGGDDLAYRGCLRLRHDLQE